MKFIVSSAALLKNLQAVAGILNSRNAMPILDDFLFELKENQLKITSSDLETTMTTSLDVEKSEGDGIIAVPAKQLMELIKTFSDIPLVFSIDLQTKSIDISASGNRSKIAGHDGEEFPKVSESEDTSSITISSLTLQNAITKTIFATSNEEYRPGITGVLFDIYPEEIIFVATDAHKLVKYTKVAAMAEEASNFIVPKKPLNQLKSVLGSEDIDVKIEYNKTNVIFSFGDIKLFSRLISGAFPNYNQIIPKDNVNKMVIDRAMLVTALRRVGCLVSQSTNQVRLSILSSVTNNNLIISGEDIDSQSKGEEELNCEYNGEDLVIGFNSKFLIELLSHIESDQISIEFATPNKAAVILPVEEESDEKVFMIISPLMLNN